MADVVSSSTLTLPEALGAPMQPLTKPRPVIRTCDYCEQPAEGVMVRRRPGDPTSKRVDVGHDACYRLFMAGRGGPTAR